jgi:hypothetical protein
MSRRSQADEEVVDERLLAAIRLGVTAGACWRAARYDRKSTALWSQIGERHHELAARQLDDMMEAKGVRSARPP